MTEGGKPFPASQSWLLDNPISRAQADRLVSKLDVRPGMKVLDFGCGPGRLTLPLGKLVGASGAVLAVDLQQEMLDRVEHRVAAAGLDNVRTLRAAAGQAQLPPDYFDLAVLAHVLGEIRSDQRVPALRQIVTALRPSGRLLVLEGTGDPHRLRPESVRDLAEQAGLKVEAVSAGWWRKVIVLRPPTAPAPALG